jgi:leucyl-tRNA synthetase
VTVTAREDGAPVYFGGTEKMSKSKNNVVEPRDIIGRFGADTARTFSMFAGPPDQSAAWSNSGAEGTYRFLRRLWNVCHERRAAFGSAVALPATLPAPLQALRREVHTQLKQADFDYARLQYNTVVSAAMKMLNAVDDARLGDSAAETAVLQEACGILLRVLYPIAPHITHALWNELGFAARFGSEILDAPWPQTDPAALVTDEVELVVQVNGKLRSSIRVPAAADKAAIERAAVADANVQKFVGGQPVKRVVVVPGKLVNVVV